MLMNKNTVISQIPDFEQLKDVIAQIAKEDGLAEQNIMNFKQNPYADNPMVLISYAKRAQDRIKAVEAEQKIKELQGKPKKILDNIQNISNSQPIINSNFITNEKNIKNYNIDELSEEELDSLLEQKYKKEWG
jgi:tRNA G10  N-methylase Trm11